MLQQVRVGRHCCAPSIDVENYRAFVGDAIIGEIYELSKELHGVRVCNISATASGGGVAELLSRLIPVYRALGLSADWRIIHGDKEFFTVTKGFHNALQGGEFQLTPAVVSDYLEHNRISANALDVEYDIYLIHDPQPAALRHFASQRSVTKKWIWRSHIDTSQPNVTVWEFLRPFVEEYNAAVFTMAQFRPPDLQMRDVFYIPPAIDPLSTKNMDLPLDLCRRIMADAGIDLRAPVLLQVSRFDPWKDPLGVIEAYRLVKKSRRDVQLVLVGAMAGDDPEAWNILETINAAVAPDPDIYVFTNMTGVGNMEVNAFQRAADLIIQKSLREGFGLVVSEALWKAKPIVAGRAGGIPMQYPRGFDRFLTESIDECAADLLYLLDHPDVATQFGEAGKEYVRQHFLLPHLIRNELRLLQKVLNG